MSFALRFSLICVGRLIYGFNVSVDGYVADAQGNIDWSDPSEELHQYWNDFERETALSFYGRRLYELMSAYWPTADKTPDATPLIVDFAHIWRDMPKVVFSRTLESVDWNSRLEGGDPVEVVTKLKAEIDGRLELAGATLAAPIVQAGLVDEYRIVVAPTAVGGGTPFFRHCRHGSRCDCWRTAPSRAARSCCATRLGHNGNGRAHHDHRRPDQEGVPLGPDWSGDVRFTSC